MKEKAQNIRTKILAGIAALALLGGVAATGAMAPTGEAWAEDATMGVSLDTTVTGKHIYYGDNMHVTLGNTNITYNGQAHTVAEWNVTITDGETTLVEGTDYTLTLTPTATSDLTNATTTNQANQKPYILIQGIGDYYYGTYNYPVTIQKANFNVTAELVNGESYQYTGQAILPEVSAVTWNGEELTAGTDYTISYANNTNIYEDTTYTAKNKPTVYIKPVDTNNFQNYTTLNFLIVDNIRFTAPTQLNFAIGEQQDAKGYALIGPSAFNITNESGKNAQLTSITYTKNDDFNYIGANQGTAYWDGQPAYKLQFDSITGMYHVGTQKTITFTNRYIEDGTVTGYTWGGNSQIRLNGHSSISVSGMSGVITKAAVDSFTEGTDDVNLGSLKFTFTQLS